MEDLGECLTYPLPELLVPPETDADWAKGASAAEAKYVLYEYSDFECPGCSSMAVVLDEFLAANPDVRLVYRHFPLTQIHDLALLAAEASEAAGAQGKFWEMHDALFEDARQAYTLYQMLQSQPLTEEQQAQLIAQLESYWIVLEPEAARAQMSLYAAALSLDMDAFDQALDTGVYRDKVNAQLTDAILMELPGTPALIFNTILYPSDMGLSYMGLDAFRTFLDHKERLLYAEIPEMTVDVAAAYRATLQTNRGAVVVDLLPEMAPTYVNSFIFLAEEDWYNGSEFFFVQDDFIAVTGDPTNTTIGYPGFQCRGEERGFLPNEGLVWMLDNGQFFFTLGPLAYEQMVRTSSTPAQFALIGQVVEGMDVVQSLARRVIGDPTTPAADVLQSIQISRP